MNQTPTGQAPPANSMGSAATMAGHTSTPSAGKSTMGSMPATAHTSTAAAHAATAAAHPASGTAMGGMTMSAHAATSKMAMGTMTMTVPHGATNILPNWLSVIWTLLFLGVVVIHARHVAETHGERRAWHSGHVLMALGMLFMFAPGSLDHFNIPAGFWQLLFANASGLVVAWMLVQYFSGRAISVLWVVLAFDLAAMVYMWSPSGFVAPITWLLVAYFSVQALLWATDRYRNLDGHAIVSGPGTLNPDGTISMSAATSLVCERDLRGSMFVMTLGMAYMLAAMQLLL